MKRTKKPYPLMDQRDAGINQHMAKRRLPLGARPPRLRLSRLLRRQR